MGKADDDRRRASGASRSVRASSGGSSVWALAVACVVANVVGFALGWYGGGNDGGARGAEALARNLWYGLVFGLAQSAVLALVRAWRRVSLLALWPAASAVGFACGVQIWKRALPRGADPVPDGRLLGIVLAVVLVGLQVAVLWQFGIVRRAGRAAWWWCWTAAGWVLLEALAVWWGYGGWRIVAVVGPGAACWAVGLVALHPAEPSLRPADPRVAGPGRRRR